MGRQKQMWPVAGIDEVGRGALAGSVVVAAIILDPNNIPPGINDSKKIPQKKGNIYTKKLSIVRLFLLLLQVIGILISIIFIKLLLIRCIAL